MAKAVTYRLKISGCTGEVATLTEVYDNIGSFLPLSLELELNVVVGLLAVSCIERGALILEILNKDYMCVIIAQSPK